MVVTVAKDIEFREKSVRNMLIIVGTIFLVDTYSTIYSVLLFGWANERCYLQDTVWVKSLSTFTERSCQYLVWVYPIIWLLWP